MEIVIGGRMTGFDSRDVKVRSVRSNFERFKAIHAGKHKLFTPSSCYGSISSFISLYTYELETAAEMGIRRLLLNFDRAFLIRKNHFAG